MNYAEPTIRPPKSRQGTRPQPTAPPPQAPPPQAPPPQAPPPQAPPKDTDPTVSASIIVTCGPDYDRWVRDALASALEQKGRPEVVCVFDRCEPITDIDQRVKVLRVEYGAVQKSRQAGIAASSGEVLFFLDADNKYKGTRFVVNAVAQLQAASLNDPRVAGVSVDIDYFDHEWHPHSHRKLVTPEWDQERFERLNFLDTCTPVWRHALEASWTQTVANGSHEDHHMWRQLVRDGWVFAKGRGLTLLYRICPNSSGSQKHNGSYVKRYDYHNQPLTVFIPLSGRVWAWPDMRDWLDGLARSRRGETVRLVLCDSSGNNEFSEMIRREGLCLPFADVRYYRQHVAAPGLADLDRATHERAVQLACARIYNRFAQECTTHLCLIIEDDILPQLPGEEALRMLVDGLEHDRAAVSGVYYDRRHGGVNSWTLARGKLVSHVPNADILAEGPAYIPIAGSGYGCLLIRREVLRSVPHALPSGELWYDPRFFNVVARTGMGVVLARRVICDHRERPTSGGVPVFNHDWFTHNTRSWWKHLSRFEGTPVQILEVGSFEGRSALWFANNLMRHPESRLLCVDAGMGVGCKEQLRTLRTNLDTSPRRPQIDLRIGSSLLVLPTLRPCSLDVIYVDGSHVGGDVIRDLCNSWDLLAPGGVMLVDDYLFQEVGVPPREWMRPAVDYWLSLRGGELSVLHSDYQVIVQKAGTRPATPKSVQHCLGHVYPVSANSLWRWHVQQLTDRLPLFNGRVLVSVAIDDRTVPLQEVARAFAPYPKIEVRYCHNNPQTGETQSFLWGLRQLRKEMNNPEASLFYWQTKGVTIKPGDARHHYDAVRRWAESMWRINVDTWPLAKEQLRTTPVTGAHCTRYSDEDTLHYSGAFLWVALNSLKGRQWARMGADRWAVERWPGTMFTPDEMGCLFNDRRHEELAECLYLNSTWKRLGEPLREFLDKHKAPGTSN